SFIQSLADGLFVPWLLILLFGTGLFLTIRYGLVQVIRFGDALREFLAKETAGSAGGVLSPFQSFMTALAATRHREHCRRRGRDCLRRAGGAVLVVDLWLFRHHDQGD